MVLVELINVYENFRRRVTFIYYSVEFVEPVESVDEIKGYFTVNVKLIHLKHFSRNYK